MPATLDPASPAGARALERLATEQIAWLTTVTPDGQPQSSPIWFLWEEGEILAYSWHRAPRNGNLETNPRVALALQADADGDDYVTMEGLARFDPGGPVASAVPGYLAKYRDRIAAYGWTPAWFDENYSVRLRITPTRWRFG